MTYNSRYFELQTGLHPILFRIRFHHNSKWYNDDFNKFREKMIGPEFPIKKSFPCLYDKFGNAGNTYSHYFIQDLYVAQKIFNNNPVKHVDIGSRVDGFVAHIASFREIELLDIRKMESSIPNIIFTQIDLMDEENVPTNFCDSISCLHALEHFGLGRYGDKIDPDGHLKGFHNITKMLKTNGIFYFSVPMGRQRIEFNAHRVFGMPYLLNWVSVDYDITSFSYIEDKGVLHRDVELVGEDVKSSFGCDCGCAIFELRKKTQK